MSALTRSSVTSRARPGRRLSPHTAVAALVWTTLATAGCTKERVEADTANQDVSGAGISAAGQGGGDAGSGGGDAGSGGAGEGGVVATGTPASAQGSGGAGGSDAGAPSGTGGEGGGGGQEEGGVVPRCACVVDRAASDACGTCVDGSMSDGCAGAYAACSTEDACVALDGCIRDAGCLDPTCIAECRAAATPTALDLFDGLSACTCDDCADVCAAGDTCS